MFLYEPKGGGRGTFTIMRLLASVLNFMFFIIFTLTARQLRFKKRNFTNAFLVLS